MVEHKLGLTEVIAIAMGGMIGGGIFAVLGLVMGYSGPAAFLALILGGLLALNAGDSYNKLWLHYKEEGGLYTYLRHATGRNRFAGYLGWIIILGYVFTISLYAYTFGVYGALALGEGPGSLLHHLLMTVMVVLFAGINIRGLRETGKSANILVYSKLFILLLLGLVALWASGWAKISTGLAAGFSSLGGNFGNVLAGAAIVFVAYEGFQLITYTVHEIREPRKTVGRAIYISIIAVMVTYALLSFVAGINLTPAEVAANEETVLAVLAKPILGEIGFFLVILAALFSTASATHATLFGTARLAAKLASHDRLPKIFAKKNSKGIPTASIVGLSVLSLVFVNIANLEVIASFASIVFLAIFAGVDYLDYKVCCKKKRWKLLTLSGTVFSIFAIAFLVLRMYETNLPELEALVAIFAGLTVLKLAKGVIEERKLLFWK